MGKRKTIVNSNKLILKALRNRKEELSLTLTDICRDAEIRWKKIPLPTISKYFGDIDENNLTDECILFLCCRYNVPVGLAVGIFNGDVFLENDKLAIPPYDESKCIKETRKKFPKLKKAVL